MEYLDSCGMREVGYTSTKLLSVLVRGAFRISTWSLSQVCNSQPSLFFCWRLSNSAALMRAPPSGLGRIACIRRKGDFRVSGYPGLYWIQ